VELVESVRGEITVTQACSWFGVPRATYYRWKVALANEQSDSTGRLQLYWERSTSMPFESQEKEPYRTASIRRRASVKTWVSSGCTAEKNWFRYYVFTIRREDDVPQGYTR
jgi:hypothetical protein